MSMETQGAGVRTFGKRGLPTAPAPSRFANRVASAPIVEVSDDAPSGAQKLLGAIPLLTFGLVVGLIAIFGLEQVFAFDVGPGASISQETAVALGAAGYDLVVHAGQVWRMFLAPLLHASSSHILGNCVAMALVGFQLEPIIGRGWFGFIFAASGLGGIAGSLLGNDPGVTTVGASGAISGLIAATLVMSFHERADPDDARKMRRRALFFGVPAILPLFMGVQGHVDYHAHLGGALVGAAIALALALTWDGESFRPRGARLAGRSAVGAFAVSLMSCGFIPLHFAQEAALAKTVMPDAVAAQPMEQLSARSTELISNYPADPRAQLIRAFSLVKLDQLSDADRLLREIMTMPWPARPYAEIEVHKRAQAFLAIVLLYERQKVEALDLAHEICADKSQAESWPALRKAKLCPT